MADMGHKMLEYHYVCCLCLLATSQVQATVGVQYHPLAVCE